MPLTSSMMIVFAFGLISLAVGNVITYITFESVAPDATIYPISNCGTASSFKLHNIAYEKYVNSIGNFDTPPDSLTLSFEVTNSATGVVTECSFENSPYMGQYLDDTHWYACGDRIIADSSGTQHTVHTNAQFGWNSWVLSVNQSWVCDNGGRQTAVTGKSVSSLTPACTNSSQGDPNSTGWQITQCTVPDTSAAVVS